MKYITFIFLFILFFIEIKAQTEINNAINYFNSFQKFVYETPNLDSSFYYVQKLSSDKKNDYWLKELLHNSFAQEFIENKSETVDSNKNSRRLFCEKLLLKMRFGKSDLLKETILPIYLFVKIQEAKNDQSKLTTITNEFIKSELLNNDIYKNRAARYGLMIYKIISEQPRLFSLSKKLFNIIESEVKNNQIKGTTFSSREELDKRAWYRYIYSYINYVKADETDDIKKKKSLLKKSFDFSPDLIDENHNTAYLYDMYFLFGEEKDFRNDYLNFLKKRSTDKKEILSTLLEISLANPKHKNELKIYYNNFFSKKNFGVYWEEAINNNAIDAPEISLKLLDEKLFSTNAQTGKWVLVDFWGTWCMPCRKDLPKLQKFYQSTIIPHTHNISLLTVACKDVFKNVVKYMSENNFSFPVAMSDGKVETNYSVQGYPAKVLITPERKYIKIPSGADWVNFVKEYCSIN